MELSLSFTCTPLMDVVPRHRISGVLLFMQGNKVRSSFLSLCDRFHSSLQIFTPRPSIVFLTHMSEMIAAYHRQWPITRSFPVCALLIIAPPPCVAEPSVSRCPSILPITTADKVRNCSNRNVPSCRIDVGFVGASRLCVVFHPCPRSPISPAPCPHSISTLL